MPEQLDSELTTPPAAPLAYRDSREKGKFLSQTALGLILKLHAEGKPQTVIASLVGVNQATVSKALKRLGSDSADLARHHLKSRAYQTSRRLTAIAEKGKDGDAVKAGKVVLEAAGVISGANSQIQLGVSVVIGGAQQPAFDSSSITVESAGNALDTTVVP